MTSRVLLAVVAVSLTFGLSARADLVFIRGKEQPLNANIKSEDAKTIVLVEVKKKGDQTFPSTDVLEIITDSSVIGGALGLPGGPYKEAQKAEKDGDVEDPVVRKKLLTQAIAKYDETLKAMKKDTNAQKMAARNLEYRIAMLFVKQRTDQLSNDRAVKKLQEFRKNNENGWQIHIVMPLIAQIQMDSKDFDEAAKTFQDMSDLAVLPLEVRREAKMNVVEVSVRAGKIAEANAKLDVLEKEAGKNASLAARVKMARAGILIGQMKADKAEPILKEVVRETNDLKIKALAHNALGEHYFKADKYNEAMWEFLFVDAVFNHDKAQHAKALYFLWKTFEKRNEPGDPDRAQECRETLVNGREFTGTEYQRLALSQLK